MDNFESLIPSAPRGEKIVDEQGNLTPEWSVSLSALYNALQFSLSSEGFKIPRLSSDQIDAIELSYQSYISSPLPPGEEDISGTIVYDTTHTLLKCFVINYDINQIILSAQWKTIQFL